MTNIVNKKNLKLANGVVQIFGCRGFSLGRWSWFISVMNNPYYTKHTPYSVCESIEATVEGKNLTKSVKVMPETAVAMYLAGKITEQDMHIAMIYDKTIIFPKISFQVNGVSSEVDVVVVPRCNL